MNKLLNLTISSIQKIKENNLMNLSHLITHVEFKKKKLNLIFATLILRKKIKNFKCD